MIIQFGHKSNLLENCCVYVGYDKNSHIRPDVFEQLKALSKFYSIVFVTTSNKSILNDQFFPKILELVNVIIIKDNNGYDFSSWQAGIKLIKHHFANIHSLLLMNDSLYGPLFSMDDLIYSTLESKFDITSMTSNLEFSSHAQSYYISYKHNVIQNKLFNGFWGLVDVYNKKYSFSKMDMVWQYELGFYKLLVSQGFSHKTLFLEPRLNPTLFYWEELIKSGMPFIKNELLLRNPKNVDIKNIKQYLNRNPKLLNMMEAFWKENEVFPIYQNCSNF